jgi:MFS family permease
MLIEDQGLIRKILPFSIALSFFFVGYGLIQPVQSLYTAGFVGTSYLLVGVLISVTGLVKAFMNPVTGFVSDSHGRKKLYSVGAIAIASGMLITALASYPIHLLVAYLLYGLGQGLFFLTLMISMVDVASPSRRALAMGLYEGGNGASILVGTALSGPIAQAFGLRFIFGLAGGLALISFMVCTVFTRETKTPDAVRGSFDLKGVGSLLSREYVSSMFCAFMFMYAQSLFITVMPIYSTISLGMSLELVSVLFIGLSGFTAIGSLAAGPISDRVGRRLPLALGTLLTAASFASIPFLTSFPTVLLASLTLGFGSGFFHPVASAIIADVSTPETRGKAYGFYRIARDSGQFVGPTVSGVVSSVFGVGPLFGLSAGLFVVGAMLAIFVVRESLRK